MDKKVPGTASTARIKKTGKIPVSASTAKLGFMAPLNDSKITPIPLTKAHFLDAYSKWNLSMVPCPPCLENDGFMQAPECYNESLRTKAVERYKKLDHWNDKTIFKKPIARLRKTFEVSGVSISIIEHNKAHIKFETLLDANEIPRGICIDSHAILSQGYFLLLDATKDWRTSRNPLVTGLPYIKFYCGVPLLTTKNEIIGVLAIFDAFPKGEFSDDNCKKLQDFSKEIMILLDTPIEQLKAIQKKTLDKSSQINSELNDLTLKLGRATSTKSMLMTVFEKDGSGSPYSQNHNFRFMKISKNEKNKDYKFDEKKLWDSLVKIGTLKGAASGLATIISNRFKVSFVNVLEIRIAEPYQIPSEYFPSNETKIEAENYRYASKLIKQNKTDNQFMTRIIGTHGSSSNSFNLENTFLYQAFTSEFGIAFSNSQGNSMFNSGAIMPFYRHNSKLVRKSQEKDRKLIDVYLRSGGYLIAMLNESTDSTFSNDDLSSIFMHTSILRQIYITS
ncbi:hypothetical protein DFJ63DRAFT_58703 [Scheffersomyces coipomensis]|uniref:uncharacterized protein n=1 Tax=Scheffersomyces coipomensis TaxID=1788519 RepID=UPI00315DAF26